LAEKPKTKSPWLSFSLILIVANLLLGYKYIEYRKLEAEWESIEEISDHPVTTDGADPRIEIMSSTSKSMKIVRYKLTSTQTLQQISKQYNCSIKDLKNYNPGLRYKTSKSKIKKGSNIKMPVKSVPQKKPAPSTPDALSAYQREVLDLTNKERAKSGLKPLKSDDQNLNNSAHAKSVDMNQNNYFSHDSPKYGSPFNMMKSFGVTYTSAGENIAMGQKTPTDVVKAWMNSSGHRANILNGKFTHLGVGYVKSSTQSYWTQQFISK